MTLRHYHSLITPGTSRQTGFSPVVPDNNQQVTGSIQGPEPTGARLPVLSRPPHEPLCPLSTSRPVLGPGEGERPGGFKVRPVIPQIDEDFVQSTTNWKKPMNKANRSEVQIRPESQKKLIATKSHSFHLTKNVHSNVSVFQASPEMQICSEGSQVTNKTYPSAARAIADDAGAPPGGAQSMELNSISERSASGRTNLVGNNSNMMMSGSVNHSVAKHKGIETSSEPKNDHLATPPTNLAPPRVSLL